MTIHHEEITVNLHRPPNTGLGISIAGGMGSTPYKANDYVRDSLSAAQQVTRSVQGIFLMKVNREGPAAQAGLLVGDKLLSVNGVSLINCEHGKAVAALKTAGDHFPVIIMREVLSSASVSPSDERLRMKEGEKYSTIVEHDGGQFGFALAGGGGSSNETDNLYISSVNDSEGNHSLEIGDRLLSINGHETSTISHDQAVQMIKNGGNQVELLLYREKFLDESATSSIDNTIEVSDEERDRFVDEELRSGSTRGQGKWTDGLEHCRRNRSSLCTVWQRATRCVRLEGEDWMEGRRTTDVCVVTG